MGRSSFPRTNRTTDVCLGTHQATIIVNALVAGEPLSLIEDRYRDANTSGLYGDH